MAQLFFTKAQLEARISAKVVRQIFDDNNDGTADTDPIDQLRADASSKVESYVAAILTLPLSPVPPELVRLSLDVAVALAAQRHPEIVRQDWQKLMKQAEDDLCRLRDGKTVLGPPPAPIPANHGAHLVDGDASRVDEDTQRFWDDMGDY